MIRVMLAEDHRMMREGLIALLSQAPEIQVVGQAHDGPQCLTMARELQPRVIVVDIGLPKINGIEVVRQLAPELTDTRFLTLTMHEESSYVLQIIKAGGHGFLLKDCAPEELISAINRLHSNQKYFGEYAATVLADQFRNPESQELGAFETLTSREREVFQLLIDGMTTKEIATQLDISTKTAENHRGRVLTKMGVRNTVELVRVAVELHLI